MKECSLRVTRYDITVSQLKQRNYHRTNFFIDEVESSKSSKISKGFPEWRAGNLLCILFTSQVSEAKVSLGVSVGSLIFFFLIPEDRKWHLLSWCYQEHFIVLQRAIMILGRSYQTCLDILNLLYPLFNVLQKNTCSVSNIVNNNLRTSLVVQ